MHDDSNIRALFQSGQGPVVRPVGESLHSDVERRVLHRREVEGTEFSVFSEDLEVAQPDDLDPTVRELPINAETVKWRTEAALLRQEHKDLDDSIQALEIMPVPDQILIARLKRKKLALRDQITTLEDKIRPDIIA